uniref:GIY-YIG domain-containing protein n=1 Tax=Rhabditophanes sp. KR3021 TaxID=114890 RepID=A0AC35TLV1_9BILA
MMLKEAYFKFLKKKLKKQLESDESAMNGNYAVYAFMEEGDAEGYYYGMTDNTNARFRVHQDEAYKAKTRKFKQSKKVARMWKEVVRVFYLDGMSERMAEIVERCLIAATEKKTNLSVGTISDDIINLSPSKTIKELGKYFMQRIISKDVKEKITTAASFDYYDEYCTEYQCHCCKRYLLSKTALSNHFRYGNYEGLLSAAEKFSAKRYGEWIKNELDVLNVASTS